MKAETTLNHAPNFPPRQGAEPSSEENGLSLSEMTVALAARWQRLVTVPVVVGACSLGVTYLIPPTFTAHTVFLLPQQQQSAAASALAALGPLTGLIGGGALRTPGDQYVALMQSVNVQDSIIDKFDLMRVYDVKYRVHARKELTNNVHFTVGKKDNLIGVDVDDNDPKRAADMANAHVEELHRVTSQFALTEAQQRRAFFEGQMLAAKGRLTQAQIALQGSGFSQSAIKVEPKAAAEEYARLKTGVTAADAKLQAMQKVLMGNTPELLQQQAALATLRAELARVEQRDDSSGRGADSSYVSKYREFKYQETLFDLFARQYELARLDESREGTLIQVVDKATPPELKSRPKRTLVALAAALISGFVMAAWAIVAHMRLTKQIQTL